MLQIALSNGLLTLITLTFFRFWAKTRIRRYLWSRISFLDDPIHYTGRGVELFLGFLLALAIFIPLALAQSFLQLTEFDEAFLAGLSAGFALLFFFLYQFAVFRSRRYKLTRTSWRHIHFDQDGSSFAYARCAMWWWFWSLLSLGLLYGAGRVKLQGFRTNHSLFGNARFKFDGRVRDLLGRWILAWILAVPTLGLSLICYFVGEFRYYVRKTSVAGIHFDTDLSIGRVIWIYSLASFMLVVTIAAAFFAAGVVLWPSMTDLLVSDAAEAEEMLLAFFTVIEQEFLTIIAVFLVFNWLGSALWLALATHPLIGAIASSTVVIGNDGMIEQIGQARVAGLAGGEGIADAFDIGAV